MAEENKGGRPPKTTSVPPEKIAEVLESGVGRYELQKQTGLGGAHARAIAHVFKMTIEEFQEDQRRKLQEVADMALERSKDTIKEASALQAATVYGIYADKLGNQAKAVTNHLHLHLGDKSRGDLIKGLLGVQAERVPACCEPVSISHGPLPVSTSQVIEISPAPK